MTAYKHYIFDLDGTLLDTIADIAHAISAALEQCGYSLRYDRISTRKLINDGVDALVERALSPVAHTNKDNERVKKAYLPYYRAYQGMVCELFPNILKTLQILAKKGIDLVVVTNKPDDLSKIILSQKMPQIPFKFILGHKEGYPVKPDPFLIEKVLLETGWERRDCLVVGDSHVDVEIAENAKMDSLLCKWGYDTYAPSLCDRATYTIDRPEEMLEYAWTKETYEANQDL